ncbi:MAG: hypothetical protein KAU99_02515 [Thermoplasmata archaeon]|nr:hypothetical protein [Thermoplasmata archaeon]MCK4455203.1 hypothetical protein [Thermoplasmata archaeon]
MLKETAMVSVLLALLMLNIITPTLMGHGESDIAKIPMMLIDASDSEVQIYIKGALSDNRYDRISIVVKGIDNETYEEYMLENESYVTKRMVLLDETTEMRIDVTAYVKEDEWWLNCIVRVEQEEGTTVLWISLEDEDGVWGSEEQEDVPFRQRLYLRRR